MPVFPVDVDRAWLYLFAGVIITGRQMKTVLFLAGPVTICSI